MNIDIAICHALALQTLLAACGVAPCRAEPPSPVSSRSVDELRGAYRSLLQGKEEADLNALRESTDDGIALQAFWESVKREGAARFNAAENYVGVSELTSAQRFLGFVEGRLKMKAPRWWEDALILSHVAADGTVVVQWPDENPNVPQQYFYDSSAKAWIGERGLGERGRGATIGDERTLTLKSRQCLLPSMWEDDTRSFPARYISLALSKGERLRAYVSIHDDRCSPYRLHCMEPDSSMPMWSADVWASTPEAWGSTGMGNVHFAEIVPVGDRVYVFGTNAFAIYIEAFAADTGKNIFRFGTLYVQ